MGIRFRCPNGHKLNVKEIDPATGRRVVGKVGYCPKCGARFRIPPSGQAVLEPSDSSVLDDPAPLTAPDDSGTLVPAQGPCEGSRLGRKPAGVQAAVGLASKTVGNGLALDPLAHDRDGAQTAVTSQPPAAAPAPLRWPPIDEAPDAIWYVRPPTGGQYGPARGDVMRQWLLEGRVPEDALVWREGWRDWETAGSVFPGLAALFATPQVATPVLESPPPPTAPPATGGRSSALSPAVPRVSPGSVGRGRTSRLVSAAMPRGRRAWQVVGLLAGLCALLGAVLVYLLVRVQ